MQIIFSEAVAGSWATLYINKLQPVLDYIHIPGFFPPENSTSI